MSKLVRLQGSSRGASYRIFPSAFLWTISQMQQLYRSFTPAYLRLITGLYRLSSLYTLISYCCYLLFWTACYSTDEMHGVLGHDSALVRLYWVGDNLALCDEFVMIMLLVQDRLRDVLTCSPAHYHSTTYSPHPPPPLVKVESSFYGYTLQPKRRMLI